MTFRAGVVVLLAAGWACAVQAAPAANLVENGSFEVDADGNGVPDGWTTSGHPSIRQTLATDAGRQGGRCAKLACTHFEAGTGWHHVMLCQVGVVGVQRGRWYRLTFWAKAEGRGPRSVGVGLSETRTWSETGISDAFAPGAAWKRFECLFQAAADVPADRSRLQFWFQGEGALWLDDVEFVPVDLKRTWHPRVSTKDTPNFIPNSSFECGTAEWGSFTPKPGAWGANLYRLVGDLDAATAVHGRHSLKIHLAADRLPVLYFDYYDPVAEPVKAALAANRGWFEVTPGQPHVLSAHLRAASKGTVGVLGVVQAEGGFASKRVEVGTDWQRYEFAFRPRSEFIHVAVGLDLEASKMDGATMWLDALQLEPGQTATEYRPRASVEVFLGSPVGGNIFTAPEKGIEVLVRGFNDTAAAVTHDGAVCVTDFLDREVVRQAVAVDLPAGRGGERRVAGLAAGRRGFFRVRWQGDAPDGSEGQDLRCALIDPFDGADSPLGMNHAYPETFLVESARRAGILWWRDWSVKWQTVQPQEGNSGDSMREAQTRMPPDPGMLSPEFPKAAFDFRVPDRQIDRVREAGGKVLVLFPFPSSTWASAADPARVAAEAGGNQYLKSRLPAAFAARRPEDFERYVRESVRHYRDRITYYQVLNEPLYTTYALPARFGYTMADYVRHVEAAYRAAKAEQPNCLVVGGIGCSPAAAQAAEFIRAGGLKYVDILDIHVYAPPGLEGLLEDALQALQQQMKDRNEMRPMWVTEFGCYADDDPACIPPRVGDRTMQRCARSSELEASADLVKLLATFAAGGVEKVFVHAGTAPAINQPDAGGVFFEYGGAPRKMYAAAAAVTRLLPSGSAFLKAGALGTPFTCYSFKTPTQLLTVVWSADGTPRPLTVRPGVVALDLMGNRLEGLPARGAQAGDTVQVDAVPVYLTAAGDDAGLFAP